MTPTEAQARRELSACDSHPEVLAGTAPAWLVALGQMDQVAEVAMQTGEPFVAVAHRLGIGEEAR